MIAGYHLMWTAYGWWLPNDPRGSTSKTIRSAEIADIGELHFGRKRIQPCGQEVREFHESAAGILKFPLLRFSDVEIAAMAAALAESMRHRNYTCYGCALMGDHVHLLIRRHRDLPGAMIMHLQDATRAAVQVMRRRDNLGQHPVWGGPGWKVYLDTRDDMQRTIQYIHRNPLKAGRPAQSWPFVKEYDGWLPGQVKARREIASEPPNPSPGQRG